MTMARDWEVSKTLAEIETRIASFGDNVAEFPLALTQERRDGAVIWVILIHVRVRGVTEFEIEAEGATLSKALRSAYIAMNNKQVILHRARQSHAAFNLSF